MHDAANRLLEDDGFCYAYDANGNLTSKTAKVAGTCTGALTTYTWDVRNRLVRIDFPGGGFAAYRYDADGRRIENNANGTVTSYVYDGANALQARYTHGPGIDDPVMVERDLDVSGGFGAASGCSGGGGSGVARVSHKLLEKSET